GSGIASIAARLAGAGSVTANDIDPLAGLAARSNAGLNGVAIDISGEDMLGAQPPAADLVLLADLVYDPEVMTRTTGFLEMARRTGLPVLIGDRTAARRPP
ncbi:MAG TPA: 50S ribosomal protein L11 methyltransferase, partial [Hyphomicrobiaceae bacterium]|nr:50S ribosomal protein L11 methyltransferase [Hyphomicrobiaceae bacterium]